jgi:hypothetical protein
VKKIFSLFGSLIVYFCVATVLAQVAALGGLAAKGALDRGRLLRVVAALHGLDLVTMQAQLVAPKPVANAEQSSIRDRLIARDLKSLDLDLRQSSLEKGRSDLLAMQSALATEIASFGETRKAYDTRLKELAEEAKTESLKDVQRTIEAMQPEQAKIQLLKMIKDEKMDDVVTIIKTMSADKRKKLVATFKDGADEEQLYEILKSIRDGDPLVSTIRDAQGDLAPPGPNL